MLSGVGEVLLYAWSIALNLAVPAGVVWQDLLDLRGEQLARSWPDASVWSAVATLGPFAVLLHFIRTRRSWPGVLLGLLWLACTLLLVILPVAAVGAVFHVGEVP